MIAESIISLLPITISYATKLISHRRQRSAGSKVFAPASPRHTGHTDDDYFDPPDAEDEEDPEHEPPERLVPLSWVYWGLAGSGVLGVVLVWVVFGADGIHPWATAVGLVLASVLSLIGVRALGETDLNPVSLLIRYVCQKRLIVHLGIGHRKDQSTSFCGAATGQCRCKYHRGRGSRGE
jgi:hypothetical protein